MSKKIIIVGAIILAGVIAVAFTSSGIGGTTNLDGLELSETLTVTGAATFNSATTTIAGDAILGGGTLSLTTTNTATSTAVIGCIQTTATSTVTPIRFVIGSSGATTTHAGTNAIGVVGWQYGTCPGR